MLRGLLGCCAVGVIVATPRVASCPGCGSGRDTTDRCGLAARPGGVAGREASFAWGGASFGGSGSGSDDPMHIHGKCSRHSWALAVPAHAPAMMITPIAHVRWWSIAIFSQVE